MRADERRVRVAISVLGESDQFALGQRSSHQPALQRGGEKGSTVLDLVAACVTAVLTDQAEPSEALRITSEEIDAVLAATTPGEAS